MLNFIEYPFTFQASNIHSIEKTLSVKGINHEQQDPIAFSEAFNLQARLHNKRTRFLGIEIYFFFPRQRDNTK